MSGRAVAEALDRVLAEAAIPRSITVDYGTEFTSRALEDWAYHRGVALDFIHPGKPVQNATTTTTSNTTITTLMTVTTSKSTTTTQAPTTTTTLPGGDCGSEPPAATFASIHCRLIALLARHRPGATGMTPPGTRPADNALRLLRKDSGLVGAPGRRVVGVKAIRPF